MPSTGSSYPGGPRRKSDADRSSDSPHRVHLDRAEDIEDRLAHRRVHGVRKRRRKRAALGFGVALLIAGAAGFWMGYQANQTSEEITEEQRRANDEGLDLTRERNIILDQLWLMEDLERAQRP